MKYALLFTLIFSPLVFADDLKYKDMPVTLGTDITGIMDGYKNQAHATINNFNEKFNAKSGKIFYVVTKLHQNESFEQVFVKVKKIQDTTYIGTIASDPLGKVKFKSGDTIKVDLAQIEDWSIVLADGKEEGNLQGKALDLLQAKKAAFISKIIAKEGKYISSTVMSVLNPRTKQEIIEIVPEHVLKEVDSYVTKDFADKTPEGDKDVFTYTIVQFPEWKIVTDKK